MSSNTQILYLAHGGGPMPLLGDPNHADLVQNWLEITARLNTPSAIVLISAHWEENVIKVNAQAKPELYYDYYNFPPESYEIKYPCPGEPELAKYIVDVLGGEGISAELEQRRGLDHGVFVPLIKMYPQANIPVVQVSLYKNLNAEQHIKLGEALAKLEYDNLLILGSGFSMHNFEWIRASDQIKAQAETLNIEFQNWIKDTCLDTNMSEQQRYQQLANWQQAPNARLAQPREEHLLPLQVCYGAANKAADKVEVVKVGGLSACSVIWE
jgi:aromatic ring-opening dioxygenase catalytic subunit (LigB family)